MFLPADSRRFIASALEEDLAWGDVTSSLLVADGAEAAARVTARTPCLVAGVPVFSEVLRQVDPAISLEAFFGEGEAAGPGDTLLALRGPARSLLMAERTALNFLAHLCGVATHTQSFVKRLEGTGASIVDTRKTTPGMRFMEKYAVRVGGGRNHRYCLADGILIKENHVAAAGGIRPALERARTGDNQGHHLLKVEIEVETLEELREAIEAGADAVLLDNMTIGELREAVSMAKGKVILEASGNITLENVREVALTGVDLISSGSLTHSAPQADLSMRFE